MKLKNQTSALPVIVAASLVAVTASAQIPINGSYNSAYGGPLALQTINTGFGVAGGGADSAGGSELDGAYGVIQGANLDIFLAGNVENNGNHLNIFVSGGAAGQSVLNVPATATMATMNGSIFSPGFQATYAYDMNDYQGTMYNEEYTYAGPGLLAGGYAGSVAESSTGIGGPGIPSGGGFPAYATIGINNNNASTMTPNAAGTAYSASLAAAVHTGFEISIPLSQIGYTGGAVEVLADVNGGGDSYLSDQFLPGLPVGTGNLGTPGFNFGNTPGEFFTVPAAVPEPSTFGLLGLSALALWRRCKRS